MSRSIAGVSSLLNSSYIWSIDTVFAKLATNKPHFLVDSEMDQLVRALGTPNNEVWPELESLQDCESALPKWEPGSLALHVKHLVENGLDLLSKMSVCCRLILPSQFLTK